MEPGTVIANRYRLVREVRAGGMGVVWEARHEVTQGRLVLKLLRALHHTDISWQSRFRQEARATCTLQSSHVVQVFDAATDHETGLSYIAMEYLEGEDASKLIRRIGPLDPDAALRIVAQACKAIVRAHEAGIIHRDLKPSNLFIEDIDSTRRRVKVLDFGIAKLVNQADALRSSVDITETGNMLGTPAYMAPEQARGLRSIDFRADVWSLGAVLHAALTGDPPFLITEGGLGQLIVMLCTQAVEPVQNKAPWVEPAVAAIVHRAMAQNPANRYASVRVMLEDILQQLPFGTSIESSMLGPLDADRRNHVAQRWDGSANGEAPPALRPPDSHLDDAPGASGLRLATRAQTGPRATLSSDVQSEVSSVGPPIGSVWRYGVMAMLILATAFAGFGAWVWRRDAATPIKSAAPVPGFRLAGAVVSAGQASASAIAPVTPEPKRPAKLRPPSRPNVVKPNANDCRPPYTVDSKGLKHFKPHCL